MSRQRILRVIGAGFLPLAAVALLGGSSGSAPLKVAGTFDVKYVEQHPLSVPDAAGHAFALGRVEGINRSTGPTPYMDNGKVTNFEFADLTQGNGPQQGYVSLSQGADTVISKWSGKITTTLSPDKTPITTFEGGWKVVKATGRYQGFSGSGNYKGHFTSPTGYTVDWTGQLAGEPLPEQ